MALGARSTMRDALVLIVLGAGVTWLFCSPTHAQSVTDKQRAACEAKAVAQQEDMAECMAAARRAAERAKVKNCEDRAAADRNLTVDARKQAFATCMRR